MGYTTASFIILLGASNPNISLHRTLGLLRYMSRDIVAANSRMSLRRIQCYDLKNISEVTKYTLLV